MVQCLSDKTPPQENTSDSVSFISLNPGVCTFNTFFDHEGHFGSISDSQVESIIWVAKCADQLKAHIDTRLAGTRWKRKRAQARRRVRQINAKCQDLKANVHWKTAWVLCKRYDHVMLPKFNLCAAMQVLGRTTTWQMLCWLHFEFRQRLQHKAQQLGARVHLVLEHQLTINCGHCLHVEPTMRKNSAKWFECHRCGYAIDRDSNGVRNVTLMNVERCVGKLEPYAAIDYVMRM
jgi:hypothetical protein